MSPGQNQKSNFDHSLSFEDVSKLFSLPLSEAADILGVSVSVLKKICNENGLERWPHRKYLAGKSIEDIKKEAAKEKSKAPGKNSPKSNVTILSATSSPGSHAKDKTPRSAPEMSKLQGNNAQQQPGSKPTSTWRSHHMHASGLGIEGNNLDEFKYGFPSTGLSECSNRWWGSSFVGNGVSKEEKKSSSELKEASKVQVDVSASMREEKTDNMAEDSECDKKNEVSLSAIRKRALEEGKKALKLSVLKKYGADKLGNEQKILLRRLFQTG